MAAGRDAGGGEHDAVPASKAMLGPVGPLIKPTVPPMAPVISSRPMAPIRPVSAPDAVPR
jgi:hypothetical protein